MSAPVSRRTAVGLLATTWMTLGGHSVLAAGPDEPARLAGAVSFDLGGDADRPPWRITLYVPPGAAPVDGWPVLYLLDGNAVTGTAIDIERVQAPYPDATGIASRFAVVGIGYPGDEAHDASRRSWDYTPPPGRSYPPHKPGGLTLRTGGADAFLHFVTTTLRSAVAQRCLVDPSRQALFGHSFGGLFVLYALTQAPAAFSHWIAASPSIYWEDAVVLGSIAGLERGPPNGPQVLLLAGAYEEALAPFQQDAPDREARRARLASTRTVELTREMTERLSRISGVTSTFSLIPGRTHMTVLPEALNAAVAFFMQRSG
ncbi:esterase [Methylobacterium sp. Leaf113]|uniref:alpha/beta hydrolase n=1 Tax=Methylobacterium sp. Leaf113 TaxID=1736259 RepID=UPI0006FDC639|nr:alpha/beta hydrolase-fold protein [Methylobacterium sp. Leaf113]KQP94050.1 esterase [Methylobacterium sp. Leaf113]